MKAHKHVITITNDNKRQNNKHKHKQTKLCRRRCVMVSQKAQPFQHFDKQCSWQTSHPRLSVPKLTPAMAHLRWHTSNRLREDPKGGFHNWLLPGRAPFKEFQGTSVVAHGYDDAHRRRGTTSWPIFHMGIWLRFHQVYFLFFKR